MNTDSSGNSNDSSDAGMNNSDTLSKSKITQVNIYNTLKHDTSL